MHIHNPCLSKWKWRPARETNQVHSNVSCTTQAAQDASHPCHSPHGSRHTPHGASRFLIWFAALVRRHPGVPRPCFVGARRARSDGVYRVKLLYARSMSTPAPHATTRRERTTGRGLKLRWSTSRTRCSPLPQTSTPRTLSRDFTSRTVCSSLLLDRPATAAALFLAAAGQLRWVGSTPAEQCKMVMDNSRSCCW